MRIYDYMKGILGAMGVGEDVGVPEPSWRIEEYLKAIYDKLKEGGSSLPPVTSSDNGKVLTVADGAWAAGFRTEVDPANIQHIPVTFDGSSFTTTITPRDVEDGFTYDGEEQPPFSQSQLSVIDFYVGGEMVGHSNLTIYESNSDGPTFRSYIADLDDLGLADKYGYFSLDSAGNNYPYVVSLVSWDKGGKFIVTLTPTSPDYSGTMDKTVAEIWDAHNSGQDIVFRFMAGATDYYDIMPNLFEHLDGISYGSISASAIMATNTFGEIRTEQSESDGTVNNYYAFMYSLTLAS